MTTRRQLMTPEQRRASDPRASAWVSASAGTGKTHVLTNRVLRLMLDGARPDGILCLTFTKAAAAEMANRIHDRLGRWSRLDDETLGAEIEGLAGAGDDDRLIRARRLFARVLDLPGGLRIQTIHAFCQSLLGRFPLEAGIAPHFQAIDERTAAELLRAAAEQVLAAARADSGGRLTRALAVVSTHADAGAFLSLLSDILGERGKLARLGGHREIAEATLYRKLGLAPGTRVDDLIAAACDDDAFDGDGLAGAARALAGGSAGDAARGAEIAAWLEQPARRRRRFADYRAQFLTQKSRPRARLMTKPLAGKFPDQAAALDAEAGRLAGLDELCRLSEVAEVSAALLCLVLEISTAYQTMKERHVALDYDDLIIRARDLLDEGDAAAWVLYKLDGGIDHILIDEAQDTNPEQWRVVSGLATEFFSGEGARDNHRTLFAVGDPKQSIFGFQRADPAAFEHWRRSFGQRVRDADLNFRDVELALSFRSTATVLKLVDAVFSRPGADDGLTFSRKPVAHRAHRQGHAGLVELWEPERPEPVPESDGWTPPVVQHRADKPVARLAERIAGRIGEWLSGGKRLASRGRPVRPGDIMILLRRRTQFVPEVMAALKARGIPVAGSDRMTLSEQISVMDLIALGRFVLLPDDDLNLAVVLKGPLLGLDDEDLFTLAHGRAGSLWRALGEAPQFDAARRFLASLLAGADRLAPFDFYGDLLSARGGRAKLLARLGAQADEPIDEFLALALEFQGSHPPSLQGFLQWLEGGEAEIKRDMDQGRDEVRVMTVHGAKGLQAPIVILPDCCQVPQSRSKLLWLDDGSVPVMLWTLNRAHEVGVIEDARDRLDAEGMREYRRLLYVALTRAEDRLYVCGWETSRGRAEGCWHDLVAAGMEGLAGVETIATEGGGIRRLVDPQTAPPATPAAVDQAATPGTAALPDWLSCPAAVEKPGPKALNPSLVQPLEPAPRGPLNADGGSSYRRGTLIHQLLQSLPELPPTARRPAARRMLARPGYGLTMPEAEEILTATLAVLEAPQFAPLFAPGSRAEVAVMGTVDGVPVSGQLDRLVVTDSDVLIVDYKTNRTPPATPAGVAPAYLHQMAAYRALLRGIYPDRTLTCALLWTEGPRLMALAPEALERCWRRIVEARALDE